MEVAIHKIHELKFPLDKILYGFATAPIPPVAHDFISGMGRTNDAIIYGGRVSICIEGDEDEIIKLSKDLPSFNSKDFESLLNKSSDYDKDFYKIDGFYLAHMCLNKFKKSECPILLSK